MYSNHNQHDIEAIVHNHHGINYWLCHTNMWEYVMYDDDDCGNIMLFGSKCTMMHPNFDESTIYQKEQHQNNDKIILWEERIADNA